MAVSLAISEIFSDTPTSNDLILKSGFAVDQGHWIWRGSTDRQTRWKQYQLSLLQLVQSRVFIVCRLERNMKMWVNTGIKLYTHCIATEAAVELGRSWIYPRITLSCLDHAVLSGGTGILIKTLFVLQYCVCISSLVPSVLHLSYGFQCSFFCGKTVHKSQTFPADVIYGQPLDITWPYNRWWWT